MKLFKGCLTAIGALVLLIIGLGVLVSISQSPEERAQSQRRIEKDLQKQGEAYLKEAAKDMAATSATKLKLGQASMRSDGIGNVYVTFTVTNTTPQLCSYADFKVVFYDAKGKVMGTGMGNVANIPAGESRTIDAMAINISTSKVSKYVVEHGNSMFD